MIKDVIVDGKKYEVDTMPVSPNGPFRYSYATICGISESPASGVIANVLRDLGKAPVLRAQIEINEIEKRKVVKALGWKFSRSRAWRNLWELYGRDKTNRGESRK